MVWKNFQKQTIERFEPSGHVNATEETFFCIICCFSSLFVSRQGLEMTFSRQQERQSQRGTKRVNKQD